MIFQLVVSALLCIQALATEAGCWRPQRDWSSFLETANDQTAKLAINESGEEVFLAYACAISLGKQDLIDYMIEERHVFWMFGWAKTIPIFQLDESGSVQDTRLVDRRIETVPEGFVRLEECTVGTMPYSCLEVLTVALLASSGDYKGLKRIYQKVRAEVHSEHYLELAFKYGHLDFIGKVLTSREFKDPLSMTDWLIGKVGIEGFVGLLRDWIQSGIVNHRLDPVPFMCNLIKHDSLEGVSLLAQYIPMTGRTMAICLHEAVKFKRRRMLRYFMQDLGWSLEMTEMFGSHTYLLQDAWSYSAIKVHDIVTAGNVVGIIRAAPNEYIDSCWCHAFVSQDKYADLSSAQYEAGWTLLAINRYPEFTDAILDSIQNPDIKASVDSFLVTYPISEYFQGAVLMNLVGIALAFKAHGIPSDKDDLLIGFLPYLFTMDRRHLSRFLVAWSNGAHKTEIINQLALH